MPLMHGQFLQPGTAQLATGYVLYGPSTMLALTTGKGTRLYTLDKTYGGFLLTQEEVAVPGITAEFARINMYESAALAACDANLCRRSAAGQNRTTR